MTSEHFIMWLEGYLAAAGNKVDVNVLKEQIEKVKNHQPKPNYHTTGTRVDL